MPLKLDFKAGDKMIINGAVVENIGNNASLLIHNEAAILREKEILSEAETGTPASRVYFALQCAYMFPEKKEHFIEAFRELLKDYVEAAPSSAEIGEKISKQVDNKKIYNALKLTQKLIGHEIGIFEGLRADIEHIEETDDGMLAVENKSE